MNMQPVWSLGLMSGTSLDGIDAVLIRTDGVSVSEFGPWLTMPYENEMRARIRDACAGLGDILKLERDLTLLHIEAAWALLNKAKMKPREVRVIGFHGQTVTHRPHEGITWQIGDGALLAERCGIDVVCDFRRRDMAAGGEGAPLVPLYHGALSTQLPLPMAVLNIGGIANVTWMGVSEAGIEDMLGLDIVAFDTGPGNVLLNEWALYATGEALDRDGKLARAGHAHQDIIAAWLHDPYFQRLAPKSLDRNYFTLGPVRDLSAQDGAATLTEFTAASVEKASELFPAKPKRWVICGGGRHNPALMEALCNYLGDVQPVETLGWRGDALEAEAFAYLAVRSLQGLPLSLPTTTGCENPVTGGAYYKA